MKQLIWIAFALLMVGSLGFAQDNYINREDAEASATASRPHPNILFIIMDDVGIDQLRVFGYGGLRPHGAPPTPNIDAIARAGIRFRNSWSMPECSPSRVMFFEGRYPLRTNIFNAILSTDVANSQLSPYETTTPNLLKSVGYTSALFGKFHLGGPDLNPFGSATPHMAGFDYFDGFLEGAPHPIDPTIGGQFSSDDVSTTCGFVPAASAGGVDFGACRFADGSCSEITKDQQHLAPGRSCLQQGGLFVPLQGCAETPPFLNFFSQTNAYYVWNRVINQPDGTVQLFPLTDPTSRHYVSDSTTQSAIDWIKRQRSKHRRWMATVSYANIHTPYQQPPTYLLPKDEKDSSGLKCTGNSKANTAALRIISNEMLEAMDNEIGRLLVGSGLATYKSDGSLNYDPQRTNTMVVIIGDNGTFAPSVKLPFDPNLSKGTAYQTGVWVPLIVAGPLVVSPDRSVSAMVNIADLFQLWGELTGIDVHKAVPHTIDSVSMLPYLTNPNQAAIRQVNFTQTQSNIHLNNQAPPPCVVDLTSPPTCVQIFPQQQLCEFEGGTWYGPGGTQQFSDCCAVENSHIYDQLTILPDSEAATRNANYKLLRKTEPNCSTTPPSEDTFTEFYSINEKPVTPRIDYPNLALCADDVSRKQACPGGLNQQQTNNFNSLLSQLNLILASQPECPGDGNEDLLVNDTDLTNWQFFSTFNGGGSSWYDFDFDGFTDQGDEAVILQNLGNNCKKQAGRARIE